MKKFFQLFSHIKLSPIDYSLSSSLVFGSSTPKKYYNIQNREYSVSKNFYSVLLNIEFTRRKFLIWKYRKLWNFNDTYEYEYVLHNSCGNWGNEIYFSISCCKLQEKKKNRFFQLGPSYSARIVYYNSLLIIYQLIKSCK